jgi:hypothetical protein
MISFSDIATRYLHNKGYATVICESEEEARELSQTLPKQGKWPCLFTTSDTTGEKGFEEFFTEHEIMDLESFDSLGIIKNEAVFDSSLLDEFEIQIRNMKRNISWDKPSLVKLFTKMIPNFDHEETGKYLDDKM